MGAAKAIARGVLSDAVKERLLEGILDGTYPPGSRTGAWLVPSSRATRVSTIREPGG